MNHPPPQGTVSPTTITKH
jgi:hypothetical protein